MCRLVLQYLALLGAVPSAQQAVVAALQGAGTLGADTDLQAGGQGEGGRGHRVGSHHGYIVQASAAM